ncbi:hypothetical protein ACFPM3_20960 [Streptomyces coeruleoprunus]|uniref:Uncharacterized protein n=1 Tax=Streptomyces coeruleoprunus TaxID=285563 RepID=A0ABV9XKB9_9ACTN
MRAQPELRAGAGSSARTYWECVGHRDWRPVTVRLRYGPVAGDPVTRDLLPEVRTTALAPRNVLVERPDGRRDVRPVRVLRRERPR